MLDLPGRGGRRSTVDCTDPVAVDAVVAETRPDAVIHLAGIPTEASLPDALSSHVVSTGALLEAMRRHGVRRIVYASSNHAVGRTPRSVLLGAEVHRPAGHLLRRRQGGRRGAAAACTSTARHRRRQHPDRLVRPEAHHSPPAEHLALPRRRRADVPRRPDGDRARASRCSTASPPTPGRGGTSKPAGRWATTRRTTPSSSPTEIEAVAETEDDRAEAAHVGGPFATGEFERPAFD